MESSSERQPILPRPHQKQTWLHVFIGKLLLLGLGVAVLGVGIHSHFASSWMHEVQVDIGNSTVTIELYKICQLLKEKPMNSEAKCPDVALEKFFVATIITCYIFSLITFCSEVFCEVVDFRDGVAKYVDLGQHALSSLLLVAAAIQYIVSAVQINGLLHLEEVKIESDLNFMYMEKLIGGALAFLQSFGYIAVAIYILLQSSGSASGSLVDSGIPENNC